MKKHIFSCIVLCLFSSLVSAGPFYRYKIVKEGVLECTAPNISSDSGKTSCEISASACLINSDGNSKVDIFLANDRPISPESRTPFISFSLDQDGLKYKRNLPFIERILIDKVEAMAFSHDGKWLFAMSAHDRGGSERDVKYISYNRIISWPVDTLNDEPFLVGIKQAESQEIGYQFFDEIIKIVQRQFWKEINFVKIEGLAATGDSKLVVGVRAIGTDYKNSKPVILLVEIPYQIIPAKGPVLDMSTANIIADNTAESVLATGKATGVSSLDYDFEEKVLYMITSYEVDGNTKELKSYMWVAPYVSGETKKIKFFLANNEDNAPMIFNGKAEAVCKIGKGELLIVFDDDRETYPVHERQKNSILRRLNQARFKQIKFEPWKSPKMKF